jgi:tight adherence protein C
MDEKNDHLKGVGGHMIGVPLIISLLVFGATLLFVAAFLVHMGYVRGHQTLVQKIKQDGLTATFEEASTPAPPSRDSNLKGRWLAFMTRVGNFAKPKEQEGVTHIQRLFLTAGYRSKNATVIFFGSKVLCAAGMMVCVLALQLLKPGQVKFLHLAFFSIGLALAGFYLPNLWLSLKIARRKEALTIGLPDALDLLVVCVEAGQGLDAAIKRVAEDMQESSPIMSQELLLVNLENMAGLDRQQALKNLGERTGVEELVSLCNILIQSDRFGTSIAQALKTQSDYIRTARRMRLESMAAKTPVKLVFPMLLFIFPAIIVVILGPAFIKVSELFFGG